MIRVRILRGFRCNVYHKSHFPGDVVEFPQKYGESLIEHKLAVAADPGEAVSMTTPRPPDLEPAPRREPDPENDHYPEQQVQEHPDPESESQGEAEDHQEQPKRGRGR